MSTDTSFTLMEVPTEIHARIKGISLKTGIKLKHLVAELINEGLRSKNFAREVALSGATDKGEKPPSG
ncbi:MAG TPA: hypothetical protein DET40_24400 [Lentisphaeria bacterium]|nr:MAG: hypothetical protein A2X45_00155 [Lentisphaerae bacterium GWF2_50_93]HCE46701.1 hypothetical protein [Lentisphaeria bacterium]